MSKTKFHNDNIGPIVGGNFLHWHMDCIKYQSKFNDVVDHIRLILGNKSHTFHHFLHNIARAHTLRETIGNISSFIVEVNNNRVIDEVVPILGLIGFAHVNSIFLCHRLNLLWSSGEEDIARMEIFGVVAQRLQRVTGRIDAYEDGLYIFVQFWMLLLQYVHDLANFHHFGRTDVGTSRKPKVKERPLPLERFVRYQVPVEIYE